MKVKDLPEGKNISSVKIKTPKGVIGYWKSQWAKGVWFSDGNTSRIYPQIVDKLEDCLEWDVTEEDVNCHKRTDYFSINNSSEI